MIWSMPCGAFTLYAIEDGWFIRDPVEMFPTSDARAWREAEGMVEGKLRISIGCFLITDGSRFVMVDAGIGADTTWFTSQADGGHLSEALAFLGVAPEQIGLVIHTHLHIDHVGGDLTADAQPLFSRARIAVQRTELNYWITAESPMAPRIRRIVQPLGDAGRIFLIDGEAELEPGITVTTTPGHTPGHQSVVIMSGGSRTFVAGDVTHHPLQAHHPDWSPAADLDKTQSVATRERVFANLTGSGTLLAAGHYPRPGLGYVETDDRIFVVAPAIQVG